MGYFYLVFDKDLYCMNYKKRYIVAQSSYNESNIESLVIVIFNSPVISRHRGYKIKEQDNLIWRKTTNKWIWRKREIIDFENKILPDA